ncbi:DUF922 domain-containing protein [Chryseobacterium sp.]|uniref:DUF922 domain-containing protein n=1 Tax=Chryseobacterium sp. TaxID=1871047 RepID=UPI0025C0D0E9|nr:DUF922 domain-containing protein [Chryseobacterium sp.]
MKWIYLLSLLITIPLFGQKIIWQEGQKLNWSQFKSNTNKKGNNVVAYTHCGWEYTVVTSTNPNIPIKIEIITIFNEDKSWKDPKHINDYVLNHEQKHFDIAEIYARKLRKEVSEKIKTSGDFKRSFQALYNRVSNEYRDFQILYDKDTQHGINEEKQAEYNVVITRELENLKNFKDI